MKYVYVSIGNSDDRLTQEEWSEFCADLHTEVVSFHGTLHGRWFSAPHDRWQNACICFEIEDKHVPRLQAALRFLARNYSQDWIAWAEADLTKLEPTPL